jgi:hypothetical protein
MPPKKKKGTKPRAPMRTPNNPPVNRSVVTGRHIFRFKMTQTATQIITLYDRDFAFLMCNAATTTSVRTNFEAIKINKISIWSPNQRTTAGVGGDPVTCSLEWLGEYTPNSEFSATTMTLGHNAHLHKVPPRNAQCGKWNQVDDAENSPLVKMRIPQDSVIDVDLSFVYRDDASGGLLKGIVGSLGVGQLYYNNLDGYYGSGFCEPVSLIPP